MISWRRFAITAVFAIFGGATLFLGCTRSITLPANPGAIVPTFTSTFTLTLTPAVANTFTSTLTSTATLSPTLTDTPNGPPSTSTDTSTPSDTSTPTDTPTSAGTPTDTPTNTDSPTLTSTLTASDTPTQTNTLTPTSTPTPDPKLIDDLNDGDAQIKVQQDTNGKYRDGYWYSYDSGSNIVVTQTAPGVTGNAAEATGSLAGNSAYAGFGFNFTDPGGTNNPGITTYDGTVNGYTGITFWGKLGSQPASICENAYAVNANLVDVSTTDHLVTLPFTTTWQQFTVYYDQCVGLDPTQLFQVKWQPTNSTTGPIPYDIYIDDIQFVTSSDPTPPTPVPVGLIDTFEDGNNHQIVQGGRDGYWYTYADNTASADAALCPTLGAAPYNGTFYPSANTNFTGNSSLWALRFTGGGFTIYGAGVGLTLDLGSGYDCTQSGAFTGIQFKARVSAGSTTSVRFKMPDGQADGSDNHGKTMTLTTSWVTYMLPFNAMPQEGWGTATTFMPNQVSAIQWQFPVGVNFDLWVDDISFY